jgi:hypothetical protein
MSVPAVESLSRPTRQVVRVSAPLVIADYYDDRVAYKILLDDADRFKGFEQLPRQKNDYVSGFGISSTNESGHVSELTAVFSVHKWIEGKYSGPSFSTEAWLIRGPLQIKLSERDITTTWKNGWLKRFFSVKRGSETLLQIEYPRPWRHELFKGHRDSDLHGPDDFYCYVDWIAHKKAWCAPGQTPNKS